MNQFKKIKISLLACAALGCGALQAAKQINRDAANPAFTTNILAKAFDRRTGTMYVGTEGAAGNTFGVARAARDAAVFESLRFRRFANEDAATIALFGSPLHVAAQSDGAVGAAMAFEIFDPEDPRVIIATPDNSGTGADNIINSNPAPTAADHFSLLTGSPKNVFMVVHATADAASATDSGILAFQADGRRINGAGARAAKLDNQRGAGAGDGQFLRDGSASANLATPPVVRDMYWDNDLETLFVCGSVTSAVPAGGFNAYMAIAKVRVVGGNLVISDTLPNGVNAAASGVVGSDATIFATHTIHGQAPLHPRILKIRTMHTSTDRNYLIVNGGIGVLNAIGNQFYCLQYDSATGFVTQNDGDKTALEVDFVRSDGAFLGQSLDGGNVGSLVIGANVAPWAARFAASDMEVVGDTVYVSMGAVDRDDANDPGVFSSRALFNHEGVIIGWTPWEKVFTSKNDNNADAARFFAVDARDGVLWQVNFDGTPNPRIVRRTGLTATGFGATTLPGKLNADLTGGCTAVLDLPIGTPGIAGAGNTHNSFALFGGDGKVVFAQTISDANAVTTDFTNFYVSTDLPTGAGYVRALGASRNVEDATQGYFFAGTDNGLYVWANPAGGIGFNGQPNNAAGLTTIGIAGANPPFNTRVWTRMADTGDNAITGAVTAIESNGTHVFVVEQDVISEGSITSKLHRFTIADTVGGTAGMEAAVNHIIIAQSGGVDGMSANTIFTGFALLSFDGDSAHTEGLIATNDGVYRSASTAGNFLHNFNPAAATDTWTLVPGSGAVTGIFANKRGNDGTPDGFALNVTGVSLADDVRGLKYYQNSKFGILGTTWVGHAINNVAVHGYTNAAAPAGAGRTFFDRSLSFWTDGGRRLFTRFNASESNALTLVSHPFATTEWGMTDGAPHTLSQLRVHFIENISGLGIVVMGTDTGVITIE